MVGRNPTQGKIPARGIRLKRAYLPATASDGTRILVDRLWPRGVRKSAAAIDLWIKSLPPSTALRKWFGHDPAAWSSSARWKAPTASRTVRIFCLRGIRGHSISMFASWVFAGENPTRDGRTIDALCLAAFRADIACEQGAYRRFT